MKYLVAFGVDFESFGGSFNYALKNLSLVLNFAKHFFEKCLFVFKKRILNLNVKKLALLNKSVN